MKANNHSGRALRKRSEEKFARAFRSSPVGLAVTRFSDGTFLEVNQATMSFLGYEQHGMVGETARELGLWAKEARRRTLVDDLERDGSVRGREITFPRKQRTLVVCDYSAELFVLDGDTCVLSVLLDITELR